MYPFQLEVCEDYQDLSQLAAQKIIEVMKSNPTGLYCFAGGDTPVLTLNLLVKAHQAGEIDLNKAHYIELDEWVGLDQKNPGSCLAYLQRELFGPAGVSLDRLHYFNALAADLSEECRKADQVITNAGGLTLTLLGVGVNGHLGFNEPGVDFEETAHVVALADATQTVGQKYFTSEVDRSQGITLGISQLLKAQVVIVEASGVKKQKAISHLLSGEVTNQWPVTSLYHHGNCLVVLDKEAMVSV
ncbi:glucosamine-6-phosphate deaminase [Vagococcus sp. BWB3-3]|uniref:Glucosamine-6-phosphate deaminase n=1 Tax=Vagococcus allomyrinae TaxID=2794353 RepID=A0A940SW78_9ENTE|nr:glucosamine-6-phosphate deaminase [Vagococcus allomyrinae]MBP1042704.1 glucosamine-6-phosphate deaminase [Vagococcus allomyrinae]